MSSLSAVNIAMQCKDASAAANKLVQLAQRLWKQDGSGQYCDDITILVIFLPIIAGQAGSHAVASERVTAEELRASSAGNTPIGEVGADDIAIELDTTSGKPVKPNETHVPEEAAASSPDDTKVLSRRRSLSAFDGSNIGQDQSIIELNKRNSDNFHGLNPNARDKRPNRSWSPEWDKSMWPRHA